MQQKLVQIFLQQKAVTFGNNTGKKLQKPRPKLKNMYIIFLLRIFALPSCNPIQVEVFCKYVLIL